MGVIVLDVLHQTFQYNKELSIDILWNLYQGKIRDLKIESFFNVSLMPLPCFILFFNIILNWNIFYILSKTFSWTEAIKQIKIIKSIQSYLKVDLFFLSLYLMFDTFLFPSLAATRKMDMVGLVG